MKVVLRERWFWALTLQLCFITQIYFPTTIVLLFIVSTADGNCAYLISPLTYRLNYLHSNKIVQNKYYKLSKVVPWLLNKLAAVVTILEDGTKNSINCLEVLTEKKQRFNCQSHIFYLKLIDTRNLKDNSVTTEHERF